MHTRNVLIVILIIALAGVAFSGYLTYNNYIVKSCLTGWVSCGGTQQVKIFGQPTCVYGLGMFLLITLLTGWALIRPDRRSVHKTILGVSAFGTAFAGFLTFYELVILEIKFSGLPACVYGLILYTALLVASILLVRKTAPLPMVPPDQSAVKS